MLSNKNKTRAFVNKWAVPVLIFIAVGVGAWLTQKYHWVFDWTRDNRNSLTEISQNILVELNDPVLMTVLARNSAQERKAFRRDIEKYQRYKSDITLVFLDPKKDIEQANSLHLQNHGELRIDYQDRYEILEKISEKDISNALQRISRVEKPIVAFLSGHGERSVFNEDKQGYSTLKEKLEASGVHVLELNLLKTTVIPDNISVLAIAAPQAALLQGEEKLITEFVSKGGNLVWLHEPDGNSVLPNLLQEFGLDWIQGTILDANQELRSILGIQHPAIVPVVEYQAHSITKNLKNQTLFPFAVGIELSDQTAWHTQPLFYSLPRAWSETGSLRGKSLVFSSEDGDTAGPILMAVTLTRQLPSQRFQRVTVIGDSDFIANSHIGYGDNLTLGMSVLQWLVHDEQRISLLPYQPPDISIEFTNVSIAVLAASYLLFVPLLILVTGIFISLLRAKA